MELKLAKGESIVKSWDYAVAGNRFAAKKDCNLTITNKRIVSSQEDKFSLNREEIGLKSVKSITGSYSKNGSIWTKIKLIVSIPLCIVIIGIFMLISALKQLRACTFDLTIRTKELEGDPLTIGAKAAANEVKRFHLFRKSFNKFIVRVDKAMAKEILDNIGALVLDTQNA